MFALSNFESSTTRQGAARAAAHAVLSRTLRRCTGKLGQRVSSKEPMHEEVSAPSLPVGLPLARPLGPISMPPIPISGPFSSHPASPALLSKPSFSPLTGRVRLLMHRSVSRHHPRPHGTPRWRYWCASRLERLRSVRRRVQGDVHGTGAQRVCTVGVAASWPIV